MEFIDTHTHIYSEEFDPDRDTVISHAIELGVTRLLLPAIDRSYYDRLVSVSAHHEGVCFPMIGLHPASVKENFREELDFVEKNLENAGDSFVGVGEIGIDLYWDKTFAAEQEEAFSRQLDLAISYDLPVVIHTRNSFDVAIRIISEKRHPDLRGIFHCFSGSVSQAEHAISLGFLLGIGGVVTYKNSGLQQIVENTTLEHLVLETDAPYLPPVPYRGQRNESSYIPLIAKKIADIKNTDIEEVALTTTRNATRLFFRA